MAVEPDLLAGTITLTNGSVDFTGAGTSFQLSGVRRGDEFLQIEGQTQWQAMVDTITSNTAGTLVRPWGGATGTYEYRLRYQPDGSRVTAQARNLIELLGNGNLLAEAELTGAANKISYFTGAATKALTDLTAKARAILGKATNAALLEEIGAMPLGMPTARIKGRVTAEAGPAEDLTQAQLRTFLGHSAFFNTLLNSAGGAAMFNAMGAVSTHDVPAYQRLPSGVVFQKGSSVLVTDAAGLGSIAFPISFGSNLNTVVAWNGDSGVLAYVAAYRDGGTWPAPHAFAIRALLPGASGFPYVGGIRVDWIAMGNV